MEVAYIVLEYIKVLAWPAVVAVAVLLLRSPVTRLLDRIRSFEAEALGVKLKGTDQTPAEFATRLADTQMVNPSIPAAIQSAPGTTVTPTRDDYAQAAIELLAESGVGDPNVRLFLGVFRDDTDMVKSALESGADVNITDTQLLQKYAARLESPTAQKRVQELAVGIAERRAAKQAQRPG